jgi:sulfatase modifying factor 1
MTGNVSEWCTDWYGNYSNTPVTDPTGPELGDYRIIRGGSWFENNANSRGAYRDLANPLVKFSQTGFRCVSPGP